MADYELDAALRLLDLQILDVEGLLAGKVDDLELTPGPNGEPPVVTAILAGSGSLGTRLGGRLGRLSATLSRRLAPNRDKSGEAEGGEAGRIPFHVVKTLGDDVELTVSRDELQAGRVERWTADHIIGKIPGAQHAGK